MSKEKCFVAPNEFKQLFTQSPRSRINCSLYYMACQGDVWNNKVIYVFHIKATSGLKITSSTQKNIHFQSYVWRHDHMPVGAK